MNKFSEYFINLQNVNETNKVKEFLKKFDLDYDLVDCTYVIKDENDFIIGTCSKINNIIKCIAIDYNYKNNNYSNKFITILTKRIYSEGFDEIFIFSKSKNKNIFESVGFKKIYSDDLFLVFTNNHDKYLKYKNYILNNIKDKSNIAILVMNCNPLTKGHGYLIDYCSTNFENIFIIPVKEDVSLFTYNERYLMISDYIKKLKNVYLLNGSDYLISKNTFPSYFIKDVIELINSQANLDVNIFIDIFNNSGKTITRVVGTEPNSSTTHIYNKTLQSLLLNTNINFLEIERYKIDNEVISASIVRKNIFENKSWKKYLPSTSIKIIENIDLKSRINKNNVYKNN